VFLLAPNLFLYIFTIKLLLRYHNKILFLSVSAIYLATYILTFLCMWPLACRFCGFESHRGHGCLFVVSVVCCQVEVSATSRLLVQRSLTDWCAVVCDLEISEMRKPWPTGGGRAKNKKKKKHMLKF
jgi:hypothetical protein